MAALLLGLGVSLGWMYWPEPLVPNRTPIAGQALPPQPSATPQNEAAQATKIASSAAPKIKNIPHENRLTLSNPAAAGQETKTRIASAEQAGNPSKRSLPPADQISVLSESIPQKVEALLLPSPGTKERPNRFEPSAALGYGGAPSSTTPLLPLPNQKYPANLQSQIASKPDLSEMPPNLITPIDATSKNNPWAFGATAGILSSIQPAYAGFNLGLSTEWRAHSNWGIRSGLGYQYQVLRENDRPILNLSTDSYVQVTGDQKALAPSNVTNNVDVDYSTPIYIPVSRLHRVEAPLLAFWQPWNRWRVYGGGTVGATFLAQAGSHSLRNNTVLEIQAGAPTRNLSSKITDQVRNWDFRWSLGIGFQPAPRFSFDLFLHNPLYFSKIADSAAQLDPLGTPTSYFESVYPGLAEQRPKAAGGNSLLHFTTTVFF